MFTVAYHMQTQALSKKTQTTLSLQSPQLRAARALTLVILLLLLPEGVCHGELNQLRSPLTVFPYAHAVCGGGVFLPERAEYVVGVDVERPVAEPFTQHKRNRTVIGHIVCVVVPLAFPERGKVGVDAERKVKAVAHAYHT